MEAAERDRQPASLEQTFLEAPRKLDSWVLVTSDFHPPSGEIAHYEQLLHHVNCRYAALLL